jgi:hypothetical protein
MYCLCVCVCVLIVARVTKKKFSKLKSIVSGTRGVNLSDDREFKID